MQPRSVDALVLCAAGAALALLLLAAGVAVAALPPVPVPPENPITEPKRVTPLAFPLLVDRTRERVSSESITDRIRRMQVALEKAAG